jgi:hypothetical protein
MESNSYEIVDIKKDRNEVRKNIGKLAIGILLLTVGIIGMRFFAAAFVSKFACTAPFSKLIALCGYGTLTAASLLTSVGGGAKIAKTIPSLKGSISKLREDKKVLKR